MIKPASTTQVVMDTEQQRRVMEARAQQFGALSQTISKKIDEAIDARRASGIEEEWLMAEEQYEGIDDANRHLVNATWQKPLSTAAPLQKAGQQDPQDPRSTLYLNITRPYTDTAASKMADMLLPQDEKNYAIEPTPIPELNDAIENDSPVVDQFGQPIMRPQTDDEIAQLPEGQPPQQVPATVGDLAKLQLDKAQAAAEAAEKQIEDWHVECRFVPEARKQIHDAARIGTGVLKGPFPVKRSSAKVTMTPAGAQLVLYQKIAPASKTISAWNLYPAPDCGENIHNGSYIVEDDEISSKQLRALKGTGYIDSEIEACLKEGPQTPNAKARALDPTGNRVSEKTKFQVFYFYGEVPYKDLENVEGFHAAHEVEEVVVGGSQAEAEEDEAAPDAESPMEDEQEARGAYGMERPENPDEPVNVIVTMVNNRIIKCVPDPLNGEFPFDVYKWSYRRGSWAGNGVPYQIRPAQKIVVGATRALLDNAGMSAGVILGILRDAIEPADGTWSISRNKVFFLKPDLDIAQIQHAIHCWEIPDRTASLMQVVQFGLKLAEDVTGMPLMMQGQTTGAPDSVGGMEILNNNSGVMPRERARRYDEDVTVSHLTRYYAWLMENTDNEAAKGDFQIKARGSAVLVERALQSQWIVQLGPLVGNPRNPFRADPEKWFAEVLRSQRLNPDNFTYDDQKWEEIQSQPMPEPPQVQVAQIKAQTDQMRIQKDTDRDTAYVQAQTDRSQIERELRMQELGVQRELAILSYANQRQISIDDVKAQLADTAMRLRVQKELAAADGAIKVHTAGMKQPKPPKKPRGGGGSPQVMTPPTEPPGRAPAGMAFEA